jgi:hypothetical protein
MTDSPSRKSKPEYRSAHGPKQIRRTPSRAARQAAQSAAQPKTAVVNTRRRMIITISAIAAVVILVAVFAYYLIVLAPMQRVLVTIGSQDISTGYFLKRMVANPNGDVPTTVQALEGEYIVTQQASGLGVAPVTEDAITAYLRDEAKTTYPDLTDAQYNTWFQQQLTNTGLSAKEYRTVASHEITRTRLTDILSASIPATLPQYHILAISYSTLSAANAAKTKLDGGADFATMATATGATNNGDLGFWPVQALPSQFVDTVKAAVTATDTANPVVNSAVNAPITYTQGSTSSSSGTTTSYVLLKVT